MIAEGSIFMQIVDVVLTGMLFITNLGLLLMTVSSRYRDAVKHLDVRGQAILTVAFAFLFLANLIQRPAWLHNLLIGLAAACIVLRIVLWWRSFFHNKGHDRAHR